MSFGAVLAILGSSTAMAVFDLTSVLAESVRARKENAKDQFLAEREVDHLNWVKGLALALLGAGEFTGQMDPTKCHLGRWITDAEENAGSKDSEVGRLVTEMDGAHRQLHASATKILAAKRTGNSQEAVDLFKHATLPRLQEVGGSLKALRQRYQTDAGKASEGLVSDIRQSRREQWIFGAAGLVIAIIVGFLLLRYLNRRLALSVLELTSAAQQVASAAAQVASSSQSLAQGSSEQASSLEETSSSCEEIRSMAGRNRENSDSAASLVTRSQEQFLQTNRALDAMVHAMSDINAQSGKISKIIKVIDEIAFQTNILALNAAVEAARAGQAGMGFAVVADEVRNLAQRSAQAAKDTAMLIEESIAKSDDGRLKVDQVANAIRDFTGETAKVKTLVDEVNLGSTEQARGIEQISKSIAEIEHVTHQIAATAEQSAAAAEELSSQSEMLNQTVTRLSSMVGGTAEMQRISRVARAA